MPPKSCRAGIARLRKGALLCALLLLALLGREIPLAAGSRQVKEDADRVVIIAGSLFDSEKGQLIPRQ